MDGKVEPPGHVDLRRRGTQLVADPARPVKEVRVSAGKPDEEEDGLHHGLLGRVDERREADRVSPIVLLRDDEGEVGRQGPVELDDPRGVGQRDFVDLADNAVRPGDDLLARAFEERVPVRREHVLPRQHEQPTMEVSGGDLLVADLLAKKAMQFLSAERDAVLLRDRQRVGGRDGPLRALARRQGIELVLHGAYERGPVGRRWRAGHFDHGVSAEPAADHDRGQPGVRAPERIPDAVDVALVREGQFHRSRPAWTGALRGAGRVLEHRGPESFGVALRIMESVTWVVVVVHRVPRGTLTP